MGSPEGALRKGLPEKVPCEPRFEGMRRTWSNIPGRGSSHRPRHRCTHWSRSDDDDDADDDKEEEEIEEVEEIIGASARTQKGAGESRERVVSEADHVGSWRPREDFSSEEKSHLQVWGRGGT